MVTVNGVISIITLADQCTGVQSVNIIESHRNKQENVNIDNMAIIRKTF